MGEILYEISQYGRIHTDVPQRSRVHFFVPPGVDPHLDGIHREHIALHQEVMVRLEIVQRMYPVCMVMTEIQIGQCKGAML